MKSYLSFAWRELKAQRVTALLILIAVIMSTVMTTIVGQSIGILQSMRIDQAAGLNGSRYATFHQLTADQAVKLYEDSRLYDVGSIVNVGNIELGNSGLTLYLREYHDNTLAMYPGIGEIKDGRLPENDNEIALPEDALKLLNRNITVGDTILLDLTALVQDGSIPKYSYSADFVLTAILESSYLGYSTGIVEGIVGNGTAEKLLPDEYLLYSTDFKTHSKADFQEVIDDLAGALYLDNDHIQYNWILLDALGISYDGAEGFDSGIGFPFMAFASVLVGVLILFAAGLVIYNILKISVMKRIKEYGTLRAVGGERKQIYCLVSLQLLILCGIGIPLGLCLGTLSAKGVLIAATGILNPELFMANSTDELNTAINSVDTGNIPILFTSAAITLLFAMTAAFPTARYTSRVPPTVAMSGQTVKIKGRAGKSRKIKIRNFEAYYARLNLKRGRSRTVITILSLVMSITVFVALQSFTDLLNEGANIKDMHTGDYAVTNETVGIMRSALDDLRNNSMVSSVATTKLNLFSEDENGTLRKLNFNTEEFEDQTVSTNLLLQSWEVLGIAGLDNERLFSLSSDLKESDKKALSGGLACLVKNPFPLSIGGQDIECTELSVGDKIQIEGLTLSVLGIVDSPIAINNSGFKNGVQIIVSDEVYDRIMGETGYMEVYPTLTVDADIQQFEAFLDEWCGKNIGSHWLSYRLSDAQIAESFEQIRMLCWVLITFIGIIGILNIINTVYSNIHTRISEIGMERAIGMSAKSLYKTFLWEGAYYGIFASIAGAVLGYICVVFIEAAGANSLQFVEVPIWTISEAAIVSIVACLLATAVPLHSIARMSIVESIETVE